MRSSTTFEMVPRRRGPAVVDTTGTRPTPLTPFTDDQQDGVPISHLLLACGVGATLWALAIFVGSVALGLVSAL